MRIALLAVFALTGCKSLTVDQIVIRTPTWLPGVDIYLDVEDDVIADAEAVRQRILTKPNETSASLNGRAPSRD